MSPQFSLKEITNDQSFDPSTLSDEFPFTQARFYGSWQESLGREVKRFTVERDGQTVAYFQLIKYPLAFGKSYFYLPYGPITKDTSTDFLFFLQQELKSIAQKEGVVFTRLDFTPAIADNVLAKFFHKAPLYTYHSAYFQPRLEWFLDLNKPLAELQKEMHEKTRYSIRLAERKGVIPEIVTEDFEKYFDDFYELMDTTAKRNVFNLHSKKYYRNIFSSLADIKNSYLSLARYQGKILTVDVIIVSGQTANYVYGGSSNEFRSVCPSYAAQIAAIDHAQKIGCKDYNFGGIADDKIYKGWDGLTKFKQKFGGREVRHSAFYDLVSNPLIYHLYNFRKLLKKISAFR